MNIATNEIEGSQPGVVLYADFKPTPDSLKELNDLISNIRLLVSKYNKESLTFKMAKLMFADSLVRLVAHLNQQLTAYIRNLKQGKCIDVFCISSGYYRDDDFWVEIDSICDDLQHEKICQMLKENRHTLQALLQEAEITMFHSQPEMFSKFFFTKKLDYSEAGVIKNLNDWFIESPILDMEKLRELRARAVVVVLESGIMDFAPMPTQREMKKVNFELIRELLPYGYEITEKFKIAYAKFRRFARLNGSVLQIDYEKYGKYIMFHYHKLDVARLTAIFEFDIQLDLIHKELAKQESGQTEDSLSVKSEQATSEKQKELFHFIHPSVNDEEGWQIHNEVKRLVKRHGIQEICRYLKQLAVERKVLLPKMPTIAYAELVRIGMPTGDGYSEKYFKNHYLS